MAKKRLQFSIRAFLVVLTLFAIWFAYHTNRGKIRKAAIEAIANNDGKAKVIYNQQLPQWLTNFMGADCFCRIVLLWSSYKHTTDADLELFAKLSELEHLTSNVGSLSPKTKEPTLITDAGLKQLTRLKNLKSLFLINTKITDDGIADFSSNKNIEVLLLRSPHITDSSVPHFSRMKSLRELYTTGTSITPEGNAQLVKNLPDCRIIFQSPN